MTINTRNKNLVGLAQAAEILDQNMGKFLAVIAENEQSGSKVLTDFDRKVIIDTLGADKAKQVFTLESMGVSRSAILAHAKTLVRKSSNTLEVKNKLRTVDDAAANVATSQSSPAPVIEDDTARMLDKAMRLGVSAALHQRLIVAVGSDQLERAYNIALPPITTKALSTAELQALVSQKANQLGIPELVQGALAKVLGTPNYESLIKNLSTQVLFSGMPTSKPANKNTAKSRKPVDPFWGV